VLGLTSHDWLLLVVEKRTMFHRASEHRTVLHAHRSHQTGHINVRSEEGRPAQILVLDLLSFASYLFSINHAVGGLALQERE
jgi:hypothetical protein